MNFNDEKELMEELNAEGIFFGNPPIRFRDSDTLRPFFSGYPIPPGTTRTVQSLMDFYIHGVGATSETESEYRAEIGMPVSGDQTARWRAWQERGEPFPTTHDVPRATPILKPKGALF
ncbi:hypothetical protein AQ436_00195 [Arthrobacter sp. EpRS66]|nr:hypothetical protein AQ436_00195 [Arthrobacter sp. EpRS66]